MNMTVARVRTAALKTIASGCLLAACAATSYGASWSYTSFLPNYSGKPLVTLLNTGNVLVVGGYPNPTYAYLYNPSTGSFATTGSASHSHHYGTATLLSNGKVLVTGGGPEESNNNDATNFAELYDPSTGTFSSAGSLTTKRRYHTATLLTNGKVLIAGGRKDDGSILNSSELYDPSTNTFTSSGTMSHDTWRHTATRLANGNVLVAGGLNADTNTIHHAQIYNVSTGTWSYTGYLQHDRADHTTTLLGNGYVLVTGGYNNDGEAIQYAELYNPATATFSYTSDMNEIRARHTATLLSNGRVLIAGGDQYINFYVNGVTSTAELFDPSTGFFTSTSSMNHDRGEQGATILGNGDVLVVGGYNDDEDPIASAEIYTP